MQRNANMLKILKKVRFCRFYWFLCKNAVPRLSPERTFVLRYNDCNTLCINNIHNAKGALKIYSASESDWLKCHLRLPMLSKMLPLIHTSETLSLAPTLQKYNKISTNNVNEVNKEINHVIRGKRIKKYIDRAIVRAGSSNSKDNGNHGNNTSMPHRAGNDKLDSNIFRKGRYFDNPSLYVKTQ